VALASCSSDLVEKALTTMGMGTRNSFWRFVEFLLDVSKTARWAA
jgi:hypothetical protein